MSKVKGKNTKPEIIIRKFLFANGYRYRLHDTQLPGRPDIVLKKHKLVIFVHGCFWHRHQGCTRATTPKSNVEFWNAKFKMNMERDARNKKEISSKGFQSITIWECNLSKNTLEETLEKLRKFLSTVIKIQQEAV